MSGTYGAYLTGYTQGYRPREPGLLSKLFDLRPGRLERAAAKALGVSHGVADEPLISREALRDELKRLLE